LAIGGAAGLPDRHAALIGRQSGTIAEIGDLARMTNENTSRLGPIQRALAQWFDLSATVPEEHIALLRQLDPIVGEEIGEYKFKIGQAVHFSPQCNRVTPGPYVVTGLLPERDGGYEYCIYNEAEPYQHVAKESELRQSSDPSPIHLHLNR
jgi:hypothetical protein